MFADCPVNTEISYGLIPDDFPSLDDNAEVGRYVELKFGDDDRLRGKPLVFTKTGVKEKSQIHIEPGGTEVTRTEYFILMAVDQEQTFFPQRFVKMLSVVMTNRCVDVVRMRDNRDEIFEVLFGKDFHAKPVQGIAPGEKAFSFRLLAPT